MMSETEVRALTSSDAASKDVAIKSLYDRVHGGSHGAHHTLSIPGSSEMGHDVADITVR